MATWGRARAGPAGWSDIFIRWMPFGVLLWQREHGGEKAGWALREIQYFLLVVAQAHGQTDWPTMTSWLSRRCCVVASQGAQLAHCIGAIAWLYNLSSCRWWMRLGFVSALRPPSSAECFGVEIKNIFASAGRRRVCTRHEIDKQPLLVHVI